MRTLTLSLLLSSLTGCIVWPTVEEARARRCATSADPGCGASGSDAGATDAGSVDAGTDAGTDAGADAGSVDAGYVLDAGPWRVAWREIIDQQLRFLVGDRSGGTLVSSSPTAFTLQEFNAEGLTPVYSSASRGAFATAAYERFGVLIVAFDDEDLSVWRRGPSQYSPVISWPRGFVATAVDVFPNENADSGVAVAAYGERDGGLALTAFAADPSQRDLGLIFVPCSTTVMRPRRILPTPDGGAGVVVGNVSGACSSYLSAISIDGGAFVARFSSFADGYPFAAEPDSPMAMGIVDDDLRLVFRAPQGGLNFATVTPTALSPSSLILAGASLTPVDVVDVGAEVAVVGFGSGTISLADGGSLFAMDGEDVFIARLNSNFDVVNLHVFVAPGDQTVAGAVWASTRLVVGGRCVGANGLCTDAGPDQSWAAGLDFRP